MSGPFSFQQKQWKLPCFKSQRSVHPLCSEGSWQLRKKQKKQKCWKWQMLNTLRYDYLCEKTVCSFFTQHFPEVWFSPSILAFSARSNHLSKTSGWTSASQSHAKLLGRVWAGPNIQKNLVSGWVCQSHSRLSGESSCHESRVTLSVWSKRPHVIYLTIRPHDG